MLGSTLDGVRDLRLPIALTPQSIQEGGVDPTAAANPAFQHTLNTREIIQARK
jgi:hypothetical protein